MAWTDAEMGDDQAQAAYLAAGESGSHEPATAQDFAGMLRQRAIDTLTADGHGTCTMLKQARYVPESGAVVCGCGEFVPWSDDPESPPWAEGERSDAAEAREFDGPIGDGRQGPAAPPATRPGGTLTYEASDPIASTLALIDPSEVYTPEDVERHILDTLWRLETGQLFEREAVEGHYRAKLAFDRKFNLRTVANKDLRTDQCKAQSMIDCDPEYEAMINAEMVMKAVKATMHNLRSVLSGYQSTARSVGATYQAGGSQGGPPQRDRSPW